MAIQVDFTIMLRGYDPTQVDALLRQVDEALKSTDPAVRKAAADALRDAKLRVTLRGYDRGQVDEVLRRLAAELGFPNG